MKKMTFLLAALMCGAWCATAQNTEKGYEYVDLGLPSGLKWATCNVGATSPEAYGDYFAWGETTTKTTYSWDTYTLTTDGGSTFTKYNTTDSKTVLEPEDDAATVNWGGAWRMPTDAELTELREKCTWTWTTLNGVNGYEVKGTNGNSIFLPAAGFRGVGGLSGAGSLGYCWSSSFNANDPGRAWNVPFSSDDVRGLSSSRYYGFSVRAVLTTYSITLAAENGTVTGAGTYPQGTAVTLTATAEDGYYFVQWSDGNTENPRTITVTENIDLTAEFAANPVYNAVGGLFSVGEGKQVQFSAGNLQYTQSADVWAFAAQQYEMLGTANVENSALADKIDIFGWSGSTATAKWGISTSTDNNDYSGDFADWGQNIGDGNTWRTLTNDEWTYLRSTRANAASLMGVARINLDEAGTTYANGLILLPDSWTCPEGITFKSGFASEYSVEAYGVYQTFTLEQWQKLEAAGAVFLPASGRRDGSSIGSVQDVGYYWSATPYDSFIAYSLRFLSLVAVWYDNYRYYGQAVRLVQDYVTYTVTATCDAEQGSVSGAGTYPQGTEVTLTATAEDGYYFVQWSDGNSENPRTITVTEDVALTAEFAANPVYNAVAGVFSVGEGKQVQFSAGNLQYTQSADVWAFAANQYDMVGTANGNGSELANTIDLFGWSGSTGSAKWGVSTSTSNSDYSGDFADWGQNIGDGNTWRTLTNDEWEYLRSTRANAASLMGVARINLDAEGTTYANGLILLPDTWTCPEGITFKSGFASDYSIQAYADYQTFTLAEWQKLEAAGAVFLPASGGRYGSSIYDVQYFGYYWSATPYDSGFADFLRFGSGGADWSGGSRYNGFAVRLVQDYSEPTKIDDLIINENLGVYAIDGRIVCAGEFRIYDLLGRDVTRQNGSLRGVYVVKTADGAQKVVVK
ncbi:MAG: hypothetical protein ACI30B_07430 [Paludibacteraceae bacterium]